MTERPLTENILPDKSPLYLKDYEKAGGYSAYKKALKEMSPGDVTELVKKSGLRGRGGAGFPTGLKWSFVPMGDDERSKFLIANADEMEPGTFKDRMLLECQPHQLIEGMLISAYAIQADAAYIFIRRNYSHTSKILAKAIWEAHTAGYIGKDILNSGFSTELHLHVSAGRYMCGEETGLLNALEGKRATPRSKPPFPQLSGAWGRPTIINNTETLSNIPHIVGKGADWFSGLGATGDSGTKIYGISGKVKSPGLWELPMGTSFSEILELGGGMKDGLKLKGFQPGGASTDFLTVEHLDIRMDFDSVAKAGSRLGTGTAIVLDDRICPVGFVHNLEKFFARESCGWCTPCREGLPWIEKILYAMEHGQGMDGDIEQLEKWTKMIAPGNTFCALAPGAAEPLVSALKYFREDFERHIKEKRCPWK